MPKKRSATYGKPALHKKRKFQLAIAKAQKVSAASIPDSRPSSVSSKLTQIFRPDTRSSPSEISAANPKIAPAGTPGTVSIFTPVFQTTTDVSRDKSKEENFPNFFKNKIENVFEKEKSHQPNQEEEFSVLCMGTPTETSTPIKKDTSVISAEPTNINHMNSPDFRSACFELFSSFTVISNNESQLQVHEESIGLNNVFSPAAAKSTENDTCDFFRSMSCAKANKDINPDIVFKSLLKLTEAGLEVRLSKSKSQAEIASMQQPLTLKTRKRRRVKLCCSHCTKYRRRKKTKSIAIKTPKSDCGSLQNKLFPKLETNMDFEAQPLNRDENSPMFVPAMSEAGCCGNEEGQDEISFPKFEEEKNMLNPNSDGHYSFTNLDSHKGEIPSQSVSIEENEHFSELMAEETEALHLEKIVGGSPKTDNLKVTEKFKPPPQLLLSQYQILLSQCAPGPDPIDLIGRRRMRT